MLRGAIDAVLETSVVGSFTKVGYEARRRMYALARSRVVPHGREDGR